MLSPAYQTCGQLKDTASQAAEGSSPSLSTNQISVIPRQSESASPP